VATRARSAAEARASASRTGNTGGVKYGSRRALRTVPHLPGIHELKTGHRRTTRHVGRQSAALRLQFHPRIAPIASIARALDGIAKAKAAGVYKGRPASINAAQVRELKAQGLGATEIVKALKIGRASVYRMLVPGSIKSTG
jgi:hypothetical protein